MKLFKNKKSIAMLVSIIALLTIVAGTTIAYLYTNTPAITNTFTPTKVTTTIEEDGTTVKENVTITNDGDIDAYVRAAVIVTWKDASGNVHSKVPTVGKDYTIEYNTTHWTLGKDGYWYYKYPLPPKSCSWVLIEECKPQTPSTAPEGYHLSVEILASAIQAEPSSAVVDAWGTAKGGSVTEVNSTTKNLTIKTN